MCLYFFVCWFVEVCEIDLIGSCCILFCVVYFEILVVFVLIMNWMFGMVNEDLVMLVVSIICCFGWDLKIWFCLFVGSWV